MTYSPARIGRTVAVTGAARGIGLEIAHRLAALSAHVYLLDCLEETALRADELQSAGHSASFINVDLADEQSVRLAADQMLAERQTVDILVNNAAVSPKRDGRPPGFEEIAIADWQLVLAINLTAPFILMQALAPRMKERGWGRIINIASEAGRMRTMAGAAYSTSKGGLISLGRTFAGELAPYGVTVNNIAPGRIVTPMTIAQGEDSNRLAIESIPVGRLGQPRDIAAMVAYLASEEASFVTGATMDVNGGSSMI
jgi:3-oxoacyl-[acyl-carrier protein] reductase